MGRRKGCTLRLVGAPTLGCPGTGKRPHPPYEGSTTGNTPPSSSHGCPRGGSGRPMRWAAGLASPLPEDPQGSGPGFLSTLSHRTKSRLMPFPAWESAQCLAGAPRPPPSPHHLWLSEGGVSPPRWQPLRAHRSDSGPTGDAAAVTWGLNHDGAGTRRGG